MEEYAIGVDIGGTKIAGTLTNARGDYFPVESIPTKPHEPPDSVIDRIIEFINRLRTHKSVVIVGVGIGVAGMTDSKKGVVIHASNLKWRNVPLRDLIIQKLESGWYEHVWVDKDTNAAALGEFLYGAGQGASHLLYVAIGTGVGGGMILDGRLYHGASEGACDFGHLIMDTEGEICGCGKRGCLETIASGPAVARKVKKAIQERQESILSGLEVEKITAEDVVNAAKKGDNLCRQVLNEVGHVLGVALAYYVDINNPEIILIGGGLSNAGDFLLEPIRQTVKERALPANAKTAKIKIAKFGADAGAIGAASLVWYHLNKLREGN